MFQQKGKRFSDRRKRIYFSDVRTYNGQHRILRGGAFQQEEIRKKCLEHCFVIFLDLRWENWKQRMDLLIENRPVLHNRTIEEMKQLFNERKSIYAFHHLKVETDNRSAEETADYIVEMLKLGQS